MSLFYYDSAYDLNIENQANFDLTGMLGGAGGLFIVAQTAYLSHSFTQGSVFDGAVTLVMMRIDGVVDTQEGVAIHLGGNYNAITINATGIVSSEGQSVYDAISFADGTASGNNIVVNHGLIIGNVVFTGADNIYDGRGGAVQQGQIQLSEGNDQVWGGDQSDYVTELNPHTGSATTGTDYVILGGGNDTFVYLDGDDVVDGGSGIDFFIASSTFASLIIDLAEGTGESGLGNLITLIDVENVSGSQADDLITGSGGRNILTGGTGNDVLAGAAGLDFLFGEQGKDTLDGGLGSDRISGGQGKDLLTGGAGRDWFFFDDGDTSANAANADIIADYVQGTDHINLRALDANVSTLFQDDDFAITAASAFIANDPGRIRFVTTATQTQILINNDDDAATDAMIILNGVFTLTGADFVL